MGDKDARFTESVGTLAEEVVDVLAPLGDVRWKKMFGGAGIFLEDHMFGLIDAHAQLHLKVGDDNRERFERAGSVKHARMPYYTVPDVVVQDDARLLEWARASAALAT